MAMLRQVLNDIGWIGAIIAPAFDWMLFPFAAAALFVYAMRAWGYAEKTFADIEEHRLRREEASKKRRRKSRRKGAS